MHLLVAHAALVLATALAGTANHGIADARDALRVRPTSHTENVSDTTTPRLKNHDDVRKAMLREYPAMQTDKGRAGSSTLVILVDTTGTPMNVQLYVSSGIAEIDQAAIKVGSVMRFEPATESGKKIAMLHGFELVFPSPTSFPDVTQPKFRPLEGNAREPHWFEVDTMMQHLAFNPPDPALRAKAQAALAKTMKPTQLPRLQNKAAVEREIARRYPPDLRELGITGTATVICFVTEKADVEKCRLQRSSGYIEFDRTALDIAERSLQFSPAKVGKQPVGSWISVPLVFKIRS